MRWGGQGTTSNMTEGGGGGREKLSNPEAEKVEDKESESDVERGMSRALE